MTPRVPGGRAGPAADKGRDEVLRQVGGGQEHVGKVEETGLQKVECQGGGI